MINVRETLMRVKGRVRHARRTLQTATVTLVSAGMCAWIGQSGLGDVFELNVSRRLEFFVRSLTGEPALDPRLRIFTFDDGTAASLNALDLSPEDWIAVIRTLDRYRPAAILIDKLFDKPYTPEEAAVLVAGLAGVKTPVIIDGFVAAAEIPGRKPLLLDGTRYGIEAFPGLAAEVPEWLKRSSGFVYGALPAVANAFSAVGHANYDGTGHVRPLIRVDGDRILPHWALHLAKDLKFDRGGLLVGGLEVPVDGAGRVHVNHRSRSAYLKSSFSIGKLVELARRDGPMKAIRDGDVVVILPAMYTGNTDWRETPLGSQPGGYVMVSVLDAVMSGRWLRPLPGGPFLATVMAVGGAAAALLLPTGIFWIVSALVVVVAVGLGLALFATVGWILPWLFPAVAYLAAALTLFADRSRRAQIDQVRMEKELETAQLVQVAFFPKERYETAAISLDGAYRPATECSGDWWGHFADGKGNEYMFIGDAVGHGVPAALLTAVAYSAAMTLRQLDVTTPAAAPGGARQPATILGILNQVIAEMKATQATMTFFAAALDVRTGRLTFANAGHPFPLLIRKGRGDGTSPPEVKSLIPGGPPLGFDGQAVFAERSVDLLPGDRVLFYTDGLIENIGDNGKAWRRSGLMERLLRYIRLPGPELVQAIGAEALASLGKASPEDDTTLVLLEYRGSVEPAA